MKRMILILLTLTALSLTGMAQDKNDQYSTGGLRNGRGWLILPYNEKLAYLTGYADHWLATVDALPTEEDAIPFLNIGLQSKGLDAFYAEPANTNITIRAALVILAAKVKGMSAADLQKATEQARKAAMNQLSKTK